MNFDDLDRQMRALETVRDTCAQADVRLAARLDGRSFTRLTKQVMAFDRPFDVRFRDAMISTVEHLMQIGMRVEYAFTESDEISLLLPAGENAFGRKLRKLNSILAGEASARFSLAVGDAAAFDCRVIELSTDALVIDYFRWRQEDAARNALNALAAQRCRALLGDVRENGVEPGDGRKVCCVAPAYSSGARATGRRGIHRLSGRAPVVRAVRRRFCLDPDVA